MYWLNVFEVCVELPEVFPIFSNLQSPLACAPIPCYAVGMRQERQTFEFENHHFVQKLKTKNYFQVVENTFEEN